MLSGTRWRSCVAHPPSLPISLPSHCCLLSCSVSSLLAFPFLVHSFPRFDQTAAVDIPLLGGLHALRIHAETYAWPRWHAGRGLLSVEAMDEWQKCI